MISPGSSVIHQERSRRHTNRPPVRLRRARPVSARLGNFLHRWHGNSISLLVTFIVMHSLGESFNLMTLGGMAAAVGLIIDDAIVVLENVVLHREAGEGRISRPFSLDASRAFHSL